MRKRPVRSFAFDFAFDIWTCSGCCAARLRDCAIRVRSGLSLEPSLSSSADSADCDLRLDLGQLLVFLFILELYSTDWLVHLATRADTPRRATTSSRNSPTILPKVTSSLIRKGPHRHRWCTSSNLPERRRTAGV
ncbi:hypothetical protein BDV10DRAFT_107580 [Aspergillus recurvatus]